MSLYDNLAAPEPEYTDTEWDYAEQLLIEERIALGWSEQEVRTAVDERLIAEKIDALRTNRESMLVDDERARAKEQPS